MFADDARMLSLPLNVDEIALKAVDQIPAMIAYWDANQVCLFSNNAHTEWFGKSREQIIGRKMEDLLGPVYPATVPYLAGVLSGQRQVFERSAPLPDGRIRHSLITYSPDIADGAVRGFFVHVADVTRMKTLEIELQTAKTRAEELATHDYLTGLPNRVLLKDRIQTALSEARRSRHRVALICMDMDNFKHVNDTYGHAEGDRVLKELAVRIKGAIRESDSLTRMGGDEFILLSPAIKSASDVRQLTGRILHAVQQPLPVRGGTVMPSVSVGTALYPDDGTCMEELMLKADKAMYGEKKRARAVVTD